MAAALGSQPDLAFDWADRSLATFEVGGPLPLLTAVDGLALVFLPVPPEARHADASFLVAGIDHLGRAFKTVVDIFNASARSGVVQATGTAVNLYTRSGIARIIVPVECRFAHASALIGVPVLVGFASGSHASTFFNVIDLTVLAFSPARDATPVSLRPELIAWAKTARWFPASNSGANAFVSVSYTLHSLRTDCCTAPAEFIEAAASVPVPGWELTGWAGFVFASFFTLEAAALVFGPSSYHIPMASHLVAVIFVPRAHALVEFPDTSHALAALLPLAVASIP